MDLTKTGFRGDLSKNAYRRCLIAFLIAIATAIIGSPAFIPEGSLSPEASLCLNIGLSFVLTAILLSSSIIRSGLKCAWRLPRENFETFFFSLVKTVAIIGGCAGLHFFLRQLLFPTPHQGDGVFPRIYEGIENEFLIGLDMSVGLFAGIFVAELLFRVAFLKVMAPLTKTIWILVLLSASIQGGFFLILGPQEMKYFFLTGAAYMAVFIKTKTILPLVIGRYLVNLWALL